MSQRLDELVAVLSAEMGGIALETREVEDYGTVSAELWHNGEFYGIFAVNEIGRGRIGKSYCYSGKHPVLKQTGDWRDKLGLEVIEIDGEMVRIDSNPTLFLGFPVRTKEHPEGAYFTTGQSYSPAGLTEHNRSLVVRNRELCKR